jgi:hypothetical protein
MARQITEAFPWDEAPRYPIRDRDQIYGAAITRRMRAMGIRDKPIAPASPWQNGVRRPYRGLGRRKLMSGPAKARATIRSFDKDSPVHQPIESLGAIISRPGPGGPHHQYCRIRFSVHTECGRSS